MPPTRQREEHQAPVRPPQPETSEQVAAPLTVTQPDSAPVAASGSLADAAPGHAYASMAVLTERDALAQMASASGGSPLDTASRSQLEPMLRTNLSGVRLHEDSTADRVADAVGAPAVTLGQNIFLGRGAMRDGAVLAHELAHVAQQGDVAASRRTPSLGTRDDAAESEAANAAEELVMGSDVSVLSSGHSPSVARRFGAGKFGHGGIESEAATGETELAGNDPRKKGTAEMYSGNFMRDMNQLNVPKVIDGLSGLPKDIANPKAGGMIGTKGAHDITTAVIQALAILELGPDVAKSLVTGGTGGPAIGPPTPDNIGAYRPEEHIDNPMGTGAKDIVVTNTAPGQKDSNGTPIKVGEPRVAAAVVDGKVETPTADADRDSQLQGAAGKGLQVENPELYKVSGAGLGNHIYNSVEATKKRWLHASALGASPLGRSEYGAGSHAVEDYFSHSNFVEVSLNSYIATAMSAKGKKGENKTATKFAETVSAQNKKESGSEQTKQGYYVDTLFDDSVPAADSKSLDGKKPKGPKRQAVTTGTFGGDDTKVSIAHILLPQMPKLQKAMLQTVDLAFGIAADETGPSGWAALKEKLSTEPAGAAGTTVLEGFATAGMVAPVPDVKLKFTSVPITPGLVGAPVTVSLPTGIDHLTSSMPVTDAFAEYSAIYKRIKEMITLVEKYADYAKLLGMPIEWLIAELTKIPKEIEQAIKKAIKAQVVAGLVAIVDQLSARPPEEKEAAKAKARAAGQNPDNPDEEFERDMGDALKYFDNKVDALEQQTSIESRLKNGDLSEMPKKQVETLVGPVEEVSGPETKDGKPVLDEKGNQVIRKYYVSTKPLPPSHSEISKDHEPHAEHPDGALVKHDSPDDSEHEKGSPFFGLARSLAVEAVKHADAQLQVVWSAAQGSGDKSLLGDGNKYEYASKTNPNESGKIHEGVLDEADKRAAAEKARSAEEGTKFLSRDGTADEKETLKKPGVERLLNLVDEFIAHPDDTTWWRPVTDSYIASDADTVYESILRRNKSRGDRKLGNEKAAK